MGGVIDTAGVAIQRVLNGLKKWSNRNLMKVNKGKHQVLYLGRNKAMHRYMLGADQLENNFA